MNLEREFLKGSTPTLVLAVLRDGPLHGYGIAREIERRSGESLRFKDGTLYPTLHSLEADSLVTGRWEHPPQGQARKVYSITRSGRQALKKRTETWTGFVKAVDSILGGASL